MDAMEATLGRDRDGRGGTARIAVCVSGEGSNLRALRAAEERGSLGGRIVLVLADRPCRAVAFAREAGIATAMVEPGGHGDRAAWDEALARRLAESGADIVVLAGFMRIVGPATLAAYPGRILNLHPALLPAFPGAHGVRDALEAGVAVTGATVHVVTEALDAGPVVLQEPVAVLPGDDEATLHERIHAVEHRILPRAVALLAAGAARVQDGQVVFDLARAADVAFGRRALVSVSDKRGLPELARGLAALGYEIVSTGGTARAIREAGVAVTDVSAVTGMQEMLDGRVKTLHPRIEGAVLADLRRADHRSQLALAGIEPFALVIVNLYPFADVAARPGVTLDRVVEEIDIGGPTLLRAAAKNHASVAIVTDPGTYPAILAELRDGGRIGEATRRRLAIGAFRHTAAYDARITGELQSRMGEADAGQPPAAVPAPGPAEVPVEAPPAGMVEPPDTIDLRLERVQRLRYGENPHQAAALYRVPGTRPGTGPFAEGVDLRQGKALSYNNILDAAAAAALVRDLRGHACAIVKHTNPCGAAEADDMVTAWERAWAADPDSSYGGIVAIRQPLDPELARHLAARFLEVVVAPEVGDEALAVLAARPSMRVVVDPGILQPTPESSIEYRSAGGAILATESDVRSDDPSTWRLVTSRVPEEAERRDLDLAWRIARHVKSNAIVLVREGALAGIGAGQMSRVDSARLAVAKAGPEKCRGAACASDAFYPFPDGVRVCTDAGVVAFVQPGGSMRDAEVIAAAEAAGVTMYLTGVRHFRH
jgi:phosphoribosylaminoimidazolecarboxamide formyltransferase / IMP cyclohydrolase